MLAIYLSYDDDDNGVAQQERGTEQQKRRQQVIFFVGRGRNENFLCAKASSLCWSYFVNA